MKNKMTESQKRKFKIIKNQQYIFFKPSQATLLSWQITKIEKTINNEIKKKTEAQNSKIKWQCTHSFGRFLSLPDPLSLYCFDCNQFNGTKGETIAKECIAVSP